MICTRSIVVVVVVGRILNFLIKTKGKEKPPAGWSLKNKKIRYFDGTFISKVSYWIDGQKFQSLKKKTVEIV